MPYPGSRGRRMRRRKFITLACGAAAWPLAARAQEKVRRIGVLMGRPETDAEGKARVAAFEEQLQKLGWTEGHTIRTDIRWQTQDADSLQRFAKELVGLRPDVILSESTPPTAALLQQTRAIPIVFAVVSDPVGSGFVENLARPRGDVSGFVNIEGSVGGKGTGLLKVVSQRGAGAGMLANP